MKLEDMSSKELLALHNRIADKPAGTKTFSTRAKVIDRILSVAKAKNLSLDSLGQPKKHKPTNADSTPSAEAAESPKAAGSTRGRGVGELARQLLLHPAGYPHALIAVMVNAQIRGARATAKSVRWYACSMRKMGLAVPERQKVHAAEMDSKQAAEWLADVKPINPRSF
ncbi:hypothetical protein GCM10011487_22400 [Steroidobacter agaridevorans]|uniref:Uncharacterized protein n=1 Tax=Steroidobacter agaridevorans TaxID=2695856 RepID=A0A829YAN0_9GAMM|nr:hypothetical protein [Steroidobacter agaridevorans]GFE80240.1 hypothetical protein GCM10011487_22400 [Steroidobacter agaridevorans]